MPKKFSFKLETVLKLRSYKVSLKQEELNVVVASRIAKQKLKEDKLNYLLEMDKKIKERRGILELQAGFHHKVFVQDEIKRIEREIDSILEIENLKRLELIEVMKDEKAIEKLKEKRFEQYKFDMGLEEGKMLDEIAIGRFAKQESN